MRQSVQWLKAEIVLLDSWKVQFGGSGEVMQYSCVCLHTTATLVWLCMMVMHIVWNKTGGVSNTFPLARANLYQQKSTQLCRNRTKHTAKGFCNPTFPHMPSWYATDICFSCCCIALLLWLRMEWLEGDIMHWEQVLWRFKIWGKVWQA